MLHLVRLGLCALLATALAGPATAQIFKLPVADTTAGNFFGVDVAIDGNRVLVGASGADACGPNSGAAYIYERQPDATWLQTAELAASDCQEGAFFGRKLALSGDRAIVAAFRPFFSQFASNTAYVFERDSTGTWNEVARLRGSQPEPEGAFAASVDLDGDRALITTAGDVSKGRYGGAAYVFERDARGHWQEAARLTGSAGPDDGLFGTDGALDGDRLVVSASTYFAEDPGSVYIFERDAGGAWQEAARFGRIDDFFISVDIHGDRVVVGESKARPHDAGAATIYERDADGRWSQAATLRPETPYKLGAFGTEVTLQEDRVLVVGYNEQLQFEYNIDRVVYVFVREGDAWRQRHIVDVGAVAFGSAVDLDGALALIGQASDQEAGQAYVVRVP